MFDGARDIARAAEDLAGRIPGPLAPLARLAYDYRWSWHPEGPDLFRRVDPDRFERCRENPVRLLLEAPVASLERAATDRDLLARAEGLEERVRSEREAASRNGQVAFFCAEFGIHRSLPMYSGGLGILAGDILKEASDRGLPMVGVGLMYDYGAFHQRLDPGGWQHDFWVRADPVRLPAALVTGGDGKPFTFSVLIRDDTVVVQVWRVQVGRVPLFLLDTSRPENDVPDRWITGRLYVGDRSTRLAQYALLGVGGVQALTAMGIEPQAIHLNEGHAGFAPVELAAELMREGRSWEDAIGEARERTIFTTHTPVPAGNEIYGPDEVMAVLGRYVHERGIHPDALLWLGRTGTEDGGGFGMTTLGLRVSRAANGVSRRHGEVARAMWQPLYPERPVEHVPIGHVTNGVHLPTWMASEMRTLLDRHLGEDWEDRAADPATWDGIETIPDRELWEVRCALRDGLVRYLRERAIGDRLAREEPAPYVEAALDGFRPDHLTIGFARRVAAYKRLQLLIHDPARAMSLLSGPAPIQMVLAGKAHPQDTEAKRNLRSLFELEWPPAMSARVAYLEDYDMAVALQLVWGCDVWVNLPRPPLEASGTSGMKSAVNGGLNLSVLDGWWAEAYDGTNGWAVSGEVSGDEPAQDSRDARAFYDLVEREAIPLFSDRDEHGVPVGWVMRVKSSLQTIGPRFSATRMMEEYRSSLYRLPVG